MPTSKNASMKKYVDKLDDYFKMWGENSKDPASKIPEEHSLPMGTLGVLEQRRREVEKTCITCGMPFSTTNLQKKYCSPSCAMKKQGEGEIRHEPLPLQIWERPLDIVKEPPRVITKSKARNHKPVAKHKASIRPFLKELHDDKIRNMIRPRHHRNMVRNIAFVIIFGIMISGMSYLYIGILKTGISIVAPVQIRGFPGVEIVENGTGKNIEANVSMYEIYGKRGDYLSSIQRTSLKSEMLDAINETILDHGYDSVVLSIEFDNYYINKITILKEGHVNVVTCYKVP